MDDLLEKTTELIHAGRFRRAETTLKAASHTDITKRAGYWSQLAQLAWLKGNEAEAEHYGAHGRACADWDVIRHEGGFHRDAAQLMIRRVIIARRSSSTARYGASLRQANESLAAAEVLFGSDKNLIGSITIVKARLAYAQQRYDEAVDLHLTANTQLEDVAWRRNNHFHLLRASRFSTNPTPSGLGLVLIEKILKEDPSLKRQLAACVTFLTGRFGCRLYDRIAA